MNRHKSRILSFIRSSNIYYGIISNLLSILRSEPYKSIFLIFSSACITIYIVNVFVQYLIRDELYALRLSYTSSHVSCPIVFMYRDRRSYTLIW